MDSVSLLPCTVSASSASGQVSIKRSCFNTGILYIRGVSYRQLQEALNRTCGPMLSGGNDLNVSLAEVLLALTQPCWSESYRIIEWFGLEGTLKIIWFQPPCHEQEHLPPAQGAQSSIQPGLETCQGGGSHSFSGQPGPGHCHPRREEFLPNI